MKTLYKLIHHHFTKRELAAEEVVIIIVICILLAAGSYAAKALLPVRVNLVQCGSRTDLPEACRRDQRCCALLEQSGGTALPADRDTDLAEPDGGSRGGTAGPSSTGADNETGRGHPTIYE